MGRMWFHPGAAHLKSRVFSQLGETLTSPRAFSALLLQ